ncbi:MAG: symmetrical bis(5'-nucleosyl)-tetraphosphatase, partial [Steroidobacteraceae bacterium]
AVGDLQGCLDEFEQLLEQIEFDPARDQLWLVGDLVNRGSQSLGCLRRVRDLGDAAITVLGNHDLHLLALASTPREKRKSKDTLDGILTAPDRDELMEWLAHRPLLHYDGRLDTILVHAGLAPEWDLATAQALAAELERSLRDSQGRRALFEHMYGDTPARWSPKLAGFDRLRFITNCLTRMRMIAPNGAVELQHKGPPADAEPHLTPWFRVPHRRTRRHRVVFGHWSALGLYAADNVICVDTGCVWGNTLSAVRLDQPAAPVQVPCTGTGASEDG